MNRTFCAGHSSFVAVAAALGTACIPLLLACCSSSPVMSGVALGKIGQGLSARAGTVPQGAQLCALQESVAAPVQGSDKPLSDTCAKALNSDRLWHRSMVVLAAYSSKLEALANGASADQAGQVEAAQTGIQGPEWATADGAQEQGARDAVAELVKQMSGGKKGDLTQTIKDASPHVNTLCTGIGSYLDTQLRNLGDLRKEIDKKRSTHADRRCATLDNRPICVSESVLDRMVYAHAFGQMAAIEVSHTEARDTVAQFCVAHSKLQSAADAGKVSSDKTYGDIVEAVKSVPQNAPPAASASAKAPDKK